MKKSLKILFILFISLFVFNVNARELTTEEYSDVFSMNTQYEVFLDNNFEYYLDNSEDRKLALKEEANEILKKINIQMDQDDLTFNADSINVFFVLNETDYVSYSCNLEINGEIVKTIYGYIRYKDYENYNEEDKDFIDSLFENSNIHSSYEIPITNSELLNDHEKLFEEYPILAKLEEIIKNTGITYRVNRIDYLYTGNTEASAFISVFLFKNGVYYKTIYISNYYILYIEVSDEVDSTIDSFKDYAEEVVNDYFENKNGTIELEQKSDGSYGHWFEICEDGINTNTNVSVVRDGKALLTDYLFVDIETSRAGVYATKLPTNNDNYIKMVNYLKSIGYGKVLRAYNLIGFDERDVYIILDSSLNGQLVKILINNNNGKYTEYTAKVEDGRIKINVLMIGEMIIAAYQKVEVPETGSTSGNIKQQTTTKNMVNNIKESTDIIEEVIDEIEESEIQKIVTKGITKSDSTVKIKEPNTAEQSVKNITKIPIKFIVLAIVLLCSIGGFKYIRSRYY